MPIAEVQFPDGRIGQFEVPEGATPADIEAFVSSQFNPIQQNAPEVIQDRNAALEQQLASQPTQNGMVENFGRGLIQGGKSAVTGALGLGSDILGKIYPESKNIQSFRELLPEAQARSNIQYQAQTGDSLAAGAGNILGQAAPFMLMPAGAATLPGRIGLGALGGAISGAAAPSEIQRTPEQALSERATGAMVGGSIGGAVPAVVTGLGKTPDLIRRYANINPVAAKDFAESNIQTSLGAISDSPSIKLADKWLSKFAGSADIMQKNTTQTLDDIKNVIGDIGANKAVTQQEAGRIIQEGGKNYITRFQNTSQALYNRVDKYIKSESLVPITNSASELEAILASAPTPNLQAKLESNAGVRTLRDLLGDAPNGNIPYKALKQYRTIIGQELATPHLIGGTEIPIYKRAYAALSKDMESAAAANGKQALNAFNKANRFHAEGMTNIEDTLQGALLKNLPEDAYQAALSGTAKGGTRINSIMRSLKPNQREIIQGTVLNQLGLARAGAQDATGEIFSTNTFLTNWNKMSPEAKTAIFGNKSTANALDKIARISNDINQIDRFGNPSGTAQQLGFSGILLGFLTAPVKTTIGIAGANATARLMTNQNFIKWLANASEARTPQAAVKQISRLKMIAKQNPLIANDIAHYIATIGIVSNRGE